MKKYTIIAGVDGVGKSSFVGILKELNSDLGSINSNKINAEQIDAYIKNEENFSEEVTHFDNHILKNILKARENGYKIQIYYIGINTLTDSLVRIENRVRKGGRSAEVEEVTRHFNSRFENFSKVIVCCDCGEIYDNENGFKKLADIKKSEIIPVNNSEKPLWYDELSKTLYK